MGSPESNDTSPQAQALADQVLAASKQLLAAERANQRSLAQQAEQNRLHAEYAERRQGSQEVALAGELGRLTSRMLWLHEHANRRFLGRKAAKSALRVVAEVADEELNLTTSAITDGEILQMDGIHYLHSGVIFIRTKAGGGRGVRIAQRVRDELTATQADRTLYSLFAYESKTGSRIWAKGGGFDNYREEMRQAAKEKYAEENPWALENKYSWFSSQAERYQINPLPSDIVNGAFIAWGRGSSTDTETIERSKQLNRELRPHMFPGVSWEYPDELFEEPLGLVMEANLLLGRTK
jgi:hypothetical protein